MKLNIFTFGTNKNKMKYLKKSEEMFGGKINYIIKRKWEGYYTKIVEISNIINSLNDKDLILFIDAYDVIINSNRLEKEILEKFKSYNCDILLGAELNCFPKILKSKMDKIYNNSNNNSNNKYINSGGYIGYVKDIKKIFAWKSNNEIIKLCEIGGDQAYFMKYYIENYNKVNIKLDTKSLIFQNMWLISWKEVDFRGGRLFNNILKTYPCFVHFNGPLKAKRIIPIFIEQMLNSKKNPQQIYDLNEYEQKHKSVPQVST